MDYSLAKDMGHCGSLWVIVGHRRLKKSMFMGNHSYISTFLGHCGSLWNQLAELDLPMVSVPDLGVIVDHCGSSRVLQIPVFFFV